MLTIQPLNHINYDKHTQFKCLQRSISSYEIHLAMLEGNSPAISLELNIPEYTRYPISDICEFVKDHKIKFSISENFSDDKTCNQGFLYFTSLLLTDYKLDDETNMVHLLFSQSTDVTLDINPNFFLITSGYVKLNEVNK